MNRNNHSPSKIPYQDFPTPLYLVDGDSLDDQQKRSKIRNLTYELAHRTKVIENISGARSSAARWAIRKRSN